MSVLISGINKSTNCKDCIFCVNDWCVINSRLHHIKGAEETTQYCPLIELPPHGRLIDADELRGWYDFHSYDVDDDDFLTEEKFDKLMVATAVVRQNIDDAPTIIEAEGEDVDTD